MEREKRGLQARDYDCPHLLPRVSRPGELVWGAKPVRSWRSIRSGRQLMNGLGQVVAVNISTVKGTRKQTVDLIRLRIDHGLEGDAHAGNWHRQVSLLAEESIEKMRRAGLVLVPGDFAENITTRGLDLAALPIGTRLRLGEVELEVTQIGKQCHQGCDIRRQVGDCVMPREGIFARVLRGGVIEAGQPITVVPPADEPAPESVPEATPERP